MTVQIVCALRRWSVLGPMVVAAAVALGVIGCVPSVESQGGGAGGSGPFRPSHPPSFAPPDGGIGAPGGRGGLSLGPVVTAATPPPAISGGTLRVLADGRTAVAADPDRDRVFVADLPGRRVLREIALENGDEPGRVEQDASGRVHIALRRGGALVTLAARTFEPLARRPVCPAPRGIAYDRARDVIHVACVGGELVTLRATPTPGADEVRRVLLDKDLRDIVVRGDRLLVTRFKSAEILDVDADGAVERRLTLPRRTGFITAATGPRQGQFAPAVAWRMVPAGEQVMVLHQRALVDEVGTQPGGYGGIGCNSIVQSVVTPVAGDRAISMPALSNVSLAVDVAYSPETGRLAIAAPGNARSFNRQQVVLSWQGNFMGTGECVGPPSDVRPPFPTVPPDGGVSLPDAGGSTETLPEAPIEFRQPVGEAVAIAFTTAGHLVAQTREPAALEILTARVTIPLGKESRMDTGHAVFHANAGAGLACASCHPEGGEDGRVWTFAGLGPRRTQSLRGGIGETAPFHWDGTLKDVRALMHEVFEGRMRGGALPATAVDTLGRWMDSIPTVPTSMPRDPQAVARGKALFESAQVGCATCHNGKLHTNNQTVPVGRGPALQVPTLKGIGFRAPFMHDGCAETLAGRFLPACGGGDAHGVTSTLQPQQIEDLVTYMETL